MLEWEGNSKAVQGKKIARRDVHLKTTEQEVSDARRS